MLDIKVTIENDKVVVQGLQNLSHSVASAANKAIGIIAVGIFDNAHALLRGGARSRIKLFDTNKKTGVRERSRLRGLSDVLGARPGSYPVPRVTARLYNLLDFVKPGETKTANRHTYRAGPLGAIIYDAADYASVISEGKGSSTKYGPRRFLTDALQKYDQNSRIKAVLEDEIQKAVDQSGVG